jgi:hypothetical protein
MFGGHNKRVGRGIKHLEIVPPGRKTWSNPSTAAFSRIIPFSAAPVKGPSPIMNKHVRSDRI